MTYDLVTHLRQMAARERDDRAEGDLYIAENFEEAADEIERLRYEVDKWRNIAVGLVENCVLKKNGVDADDKSYAEYWAALGEGDKQ